MTREELVQKLFSPDKNIQVLEQAQTPALSVPLKEWFEFAKKLNSDPELLFDMLSDQAAVDWPQENVIELVFQLISTHHVHSLMLSVKLSRENPIAPSLNKIWAISEFQEREIYDLFGVKFAGHPDLRRLFLEDDWQGYPLLKDYKDDFLLERPW